MTPGSRWVSEMVVPTLEQEPQRRSRWAPVEEERGRVSMRQVEL